MFSRLSDQAWPLIAAFVALATTLPVSAQEGPGYSPTEIRIGHIIAYSGPASAYAPIGEALQAYVAKVNSEGGVNGRQIRFISYDDGYSPPRTVEMARRLVERDDVLFLFNTLGTPTNVAIRDYLNENGIPQLFTASTSTVLDDPANYPWTIQWGPTAAVQGRIYGEYVLANVTSPHIGVLYQNDDFGRDLLAGLEGAVADKAPISALGYEVTDPGIDAQILNLRAAGCNVLMIFATPRFAAQAIRRAAEIGWEPVRFLPNVSTSITAVLEPAGLDHATGIYALAYLKDPNDPALAEDPGVAEWRTFMTEWYPSGDQRNIFNVYGYVLGQLLREILTRAGDDLSRENILEVATSLDAWSVPQLLPGVTITTSPKDYVPLETLQMQRFNGATWELFGDPVAGAR